MLIQKKIRAGFAVALVFLILAGASAWWSELRNVETFQAVKRTYEVLDDLESMLVEMLSTETGSRGFAISGDEKFLTPYQAAIPAARKSLRAAGRMTRDNPGQQARLAALEPLIEQKIRHVEEVIRLRQSGDAAGALALVTSGEGQQTMDEIRMLIGELEDAEEKMLLPLAAKAEALARMLKAAVALGGLLSFGLVGFASIIVQRDLAKRQQAEEALRRSEESLAVTLDSIGDAVLATDTGGRVTRVNPVAEILTGWKQAEAFGRPVGEVFRIMNEETRNPTAIPVDDVLATGRVHGLANHTVLIARDGTERPIADSAAPIRDRDRRILGVVLVFRDVTLEKKAEKALRESERQLHVLNEELERRVVERTTEMRQALLTLDATEDGAFIFDPETLRFTRVNAGAVRQLGYSREELLAMTPREIGPEFDEPRFRERIAPVLRGEVPSHRFITVHRHRGGRVFPVEINVQYVTPEGGPPRFVAIARDITERQLHERLALRSQRLESIGTLAGGVAHDLNNALAPIVMGMELLREQCPGESKIMEMFEASARRSTDMVRQLLAFARGAGGERVSLQPGTIVGELENLMKGSFPKDIRLAVKCDPALPMVLGDVTQLHQVLLNLCVNARDAMPQGGTLTLEASVRDVDASYASSVPDAAPGKYVMLRVRDTGTGIPPQILDRIFDPFFTTKGPDKGTGLGLSTVMGIVKGHGGFVQVYSQPGEGSAFSAFLPADGVATGAAPATHTAADFRGRGEVILFVDDEAAVRQMAHAILQRLNFTPLTATDGADALTQIAQHGAGLRAIITDLHMPHVDGLVFVRALRRFLPDMPVAVASGRMDDAVAAEFRALKVTAMLDKPFTVIQLAEALKSLLAHA